MAIISYYLYIKDEKEKKRKMYSVARTKMKLEEGTVNVGGKEIKVFYDVNGIYQKNEGEYLQSVINTPKGLKINKTDKYTSVGRNVGDYASEFVMDMRTVSPESEYSLYQRRECVWPP